NGAVVFTISVNTGTGDVTLTQLRAVHENTIDNPADGSEGISLNSVANLVTLTATITDADGDNASASIDLGSHMTFHDDGPSISPVVEGETPSLNVDESFLTTASNPTNGS